MLSVNRLSLSAPGKGGRELRMDARAGLASALHQEATGSTGLDDFGIDDYRTALGVLLQAADEWPGLDERGQMVLSMQVTGQLVSRLRSQAGWKARPDF